MAKINLNEMVEKKHVQLIFNIEWYQLEKSLYVVKLEFQHNITESQANLCGAWFWTNEMSLWAGPILQK